MKKITPHKVFLFFNTLLMILLIVVMFYPMLHVILASFSDPVAYASHQGFLLKPIAPYTLEAYRDVFRHPLFFSGFRNTFIIVVLGTVINIVMTAFGAFFMSQKGPMWRRPLTLMMLFTMYFGGGLVPNYMLVRNLGLYNTHWALILPIAIEFSYMIIMNAAFQAVPDSLTESALLDGASYLTILFKIMIPLSKATIAVLALYYALNLWNEWFTPAIYLKDNELFPIQLVVRNLTETNVSIVGDAEEVRYAQLMKYAVCIVVSAPVIAIYPFIQKYFTKGVMLGSVKS